MPLPLAAPGVLGSITGALGSFASGIATGAKLAGNAAVSGVTAVKNKVAGPPAPEAAANSTVGGRRRKSRKSKKSKKKTHRRRR